MDIALHSRRKIVVDDFSHALEIHTSGHDFRRDHDPTFASPHSAHGVLTFLGRQPCMEAIDIWNAVEDKFFGQRCSSSLRGREYEQWWIIGLGEIRQKTWEFGGVIGHIS
jgi:hypothetical protein